MEPHFFEGIAQYENLKFEKIVDGFQCRRLELALRNVCEEKTQ